MTDKEKLKAAAEKATPGPWRRAATVFNGITCGPFSLTNEKVLANVAEKANAEFIAAANPAAVLELIAALEAAQKRNAELEKRVAELEARKITVRFDTIPMSELGNVSDGKAHPYLFGAGYNSATVRCKSELQLACAAAGINLETGGEA